MLPAAVGIGVRAYARARRSVRYYLIVSAIPLAFAPRWGLRTTAALLVPPVAFGVLTLNLGLFHQLDPSDHIEAIGQSVHFGVSGSYRDKVIARNRAKLRAPVSRMPTPRSGGVPHRSSTW